MCSWRCLLLRLGRRGVVNSSIAFDHALRRAVCIILRLGHGHGCCPSGRGRHCHGWCPLVTFALRRTKVIFTARAVGRRHRRGGRWSCYGLRSSVVLVLGSRKRIVATCAVGRSRGGHLGQEDVLRGGLAAPVRRPGRFIRLCGRPCRRARERNIQGMRHPRRRPFHSGLADEDRRLCVRPGTTAVGGRGGGRRVAVAVAEPPRCPR